MKWMEIDIKKLVPAKWNYKTDNPFMTERLMNNIKRNGQIENIIIRELETGFYEVVNGNHRLSVLQELKFKKVFAYNLGIISTPAAQRIAIETNETKFDADTIKLAEVMKEILSAYSTKEIVETIPFTEEEVDDLMKMLSFDWSQYGKKGEDGEYTNEKMKSIWIQVEEDQYVDFCQDLVGMVEKYKEFINIEWDIQEVKKNKFKDGGKK